MLPIHTLALFFHHRPHSSSDRLSLHHDFFYLCPQLKHYQQSPKHHVSFPPCIRHIIPTHFSRHNLFPRHSGLFPVLSRTKLLHFYSRIFTRLQVYPLCHDYFTSLPLLRSLTPLASYNTLFTLTPHAVHHILYWFYHILLCTVAISSLQYPFLLSLPACKSPISIVHTAVKNVIQLILSYSTSLFHQSYLHLKIYIVHHLFQYTPSQPRNKIHIKTNCCSFIDLLSQFQTHVQIYSTYHSHTFPCYTSSFTLLLYHLYFNLHT